MKPRIAVIVSVVFVIGLGLASRRDEGVFPRMFGKYPEDALWTVAAYLGWKLLLPTAVPWRLGLAALGVSFSVEFLQLYHVPWLDEIRGNPIGHLLLGSTFNPMDLVAYLVGAASVFLVDRFLASRGPLPFRGA